ncbi:MAG: transcription initiation factor TFIIIB [Candidatus Nitrosotenuis sp.]|nr:MAG: transcription initiation factor TFIIIB [Candidatus Nitrosotenuis sp.]
MHYQFPKRYTATDCTKDATITDETTGEILCGQCGLVLVEKTEAPDEIQFNVLEDHLNKTRIGSATSLIMYDRGLQTVMSDVARDARGKTISKNMKNEFCRLRLWDERRKTDSTSQSLRSALVNLDTLKDKLSIPNPIAERAAYICRKAVESRITRGRTILSITCASLYAACRESSTPRTLDEITKAANAPKRSVSHTYNTLLSMFNLQPTNHNLAEFVNKLGNQLNVSEKTKRKALSILSKIEDKEICAGRNPKSVAATLLYLACTLDDEKKNQKVIAKTALVCPTTIQNTMRILKKNLDIRSL